MSRGALISLMLCLLFASLFYAEVTGLLRQNIDPIAYLSESSGTVLRLPSGNTIWDRVSTGGLFSNEDILATGDDAQAVLQFPAWGELQVDANSMVVVSKTPLGDTRLDFVIGEGALHIREGESGKVSIKPNPKVKVSGPQRDAGLDRGPLPFRVSSAEFSFGKTQLDGYVDFSRPVPVPEIRKAPAPEILYPPMILSGPADASHIDFNRISQLKLSWKSRGRSKSGYEVIFTPSVRGSKPLVFQSPVSTLVLKELPSGTYSWFVRSIHQDGKRSPASRARRLTVRAKTGLKKPTLLPEIWTDDEKGGN